jgi:hypothetical protein
VGIPPSLAHLELTHISINELSEFKKLKPVKFQDGTRFTWKGHVIWKDGAAVKLDIGAKLVILGKGEWPVNVTMTVDAPGIDFGVIAAFDREKMCDVWGHVFQSSAGCLAHPMFLDTHKGVSGLKLSELTLHANDFSLDELSMPHLPFGLEKFVENYLKTMLEEKKPEILANLTTSVSAAARNAANEGILLEIAAFQKYYPCDMDAVAPVPEVSEVCFNNNAAFAMKWGYANCPTHEVALSSSTFPIDKTECKAVTDIWPDAQPGQILRGTTEAIAGLHEIIDPAIRYQPNTNRAVYSCSGTTLIYKCELISVAPVDTAKVAKASQICVLNQAAFVAHFNAQDVTTGNWLGESEHFPINQRRCLDFKDFEVAQGEQYRTRVHAVAGKDVTLERVVEFKADAPAITFICKGTTLNFHCDTLASVASGVVVV